ncbi:MAG: TlpA family protein disulfide reductase [Sulfurovaceae bacterium]|nr:TlpA family protein disulfide reductase [Sulfurovaceae bacterium]
MRKILLSILLIFGFTLAFADGAPQAKAETFTLTDTDGKQLHITHTEGGLNFQEHQGKAVFLVLFGHMCPPCNAEIPEFIELTEKYKDKLAIVGIEAQRYSMDKLREFKTKKNINYALIPGKDNDDFIGYIAQRAGWSGQIPFLIALDKNGVVQDMMPGFVAKEKLEKLILQLTK